MIDVAVAVILLGYMVLGLSTGVIRRVIGLVGVFVACLVATHMGPPASGIVQQAASGTTLPDARLAGWFGFFLLIVLILEIMAALIRDLLRLSVVAFNRASGGLVGLATGVVAVTAGFYMLAGYAQPLGGGSIGDRQIQVRDAITNSAFAFDLVKTSGPIVLPLLNGVLPRDPHAFFSLAAASP